MCSVESSQPRTLRRIPITGLGAPARDYEWGALGFATTLEVPEYGGLHRGNQVLTVRGRRNHTVPRGAQ